MPRRPPGLETAAFCLQTVEESTVHDTPHVDAARCPPMDNIMDFVFIGSWRDLEMPDKLQSAGITHVLSVAKECSVPGFSEAKLDGFATKKIPLDDNQHENLQHYIDDACEFIERARNCGGKCLVHCRRGISRSPAIVVGYLMRHHGHRYDSAVKFVEQRRTCISINLAFREFLATYESPLASKPAPAPTVDDFVTPTPGTSEKGDDNMGAHTLSSVPGEELHDRDKSPAEDDEDDVRPAATAASATPFE